MRVRIITSGSQGDVRPYVALGVGLRAAGHDVRVISHPAFEALIRNRGLEFAPVVGDPREVAGKEDNHLRGLHDRGRSLLRWWRALKEEEVPLLRRRLAECWRGCSDADAIVVSTVPYLLGYAVAKKLGVPLIRAFYFPVSPTRTHPIDLVPSWLPLGGRLNRATYDVQRQLLWTVVRPWFAAACRDALGITDLPRREPFGDLDRRQQLLLYAYSAAVAPPPPDWGSWQVVTGYWFLDRSADWTPPPELAAFLEGGPRPVCIGFGSMTFDRDELLPIVCEALELSGQRGVLLTGWGGLRPPELPPHVMAVEWAPLAWLFARMAAVVHHGGAGTTADGLRAGIPTVVVPFFYDQFLWARRVQALGAGPSPIPRKGLDARRLAAAITTAVTNDDMRRRAAEAGKHIREEDGVARAVTAFEQHFGRAIDTVPAAVGASAPAPSAR